MKINGIERGGFAVPESDMRIMLHEVNADGLSVGEAVEIEDDESTYYGRVIVSIDGGTVECDGESVWKYEQRDAEIADIWEVISDIVIGG